MRIDSFFAILEKICRREEDGRCLDACRVIGRHRSKACQMPARRSTHQPQFVRRDFVVPGVFLYPANCHVEVRQHFRRAELGNRPGAHGKDCEPFAAHSFEDLRTNVIINLAPVGVPSTAGHVHDGMSVFLYVFWDEDIRDQGQAVDFAVNNVFMLRIQCVSGGGLGSRQQEHAERHEGDDGLHDGLFVNKSWK